MREKIIQIEPNATSRVHNETKIIEKKMIEIKHCHQDDTLYGIDVLSDVLKLEFSSLKEAIKAKTEVMYH